MLCLILDRRDGHRRPPDPSGDQNSLNKLIDVSVQSVGAVKEHGPKTLGPPTRSDGVLNVVPHPDSTQTTPSTRSLPRRTVRFFGTHVSE